MILCVVFTEFIPHRLVSLHCKSLPFNSFAAPHPLNSVLSILYKNSGGEGATIPYSHSGTNLSSHIYFFFNHF
jgi:hypothetical protein